MSIELFLYLANVLGNVAVTLCIFGIAALVTCILTIIFTHVEGIDFEWNSFPTYAGITAFVVFIIASLIPSERTMYLMAGASVGKQMLQTETAAKVQKLIDQKLDELIDQTGKK